MGRRRKSQSLKFPRLNGQLDVKFQEVNYQMCTKEEKYRVDINVLDVLDLCVIFFFLLTFRVLNNSALVIITRLYKVFVSPIGAHRWGFNQSELRILNN